MEDTRKQKKCEIQNFQQGYMGCSERLWKVQT